MLKHLRSVGNHLPVEVFHYEGELQDHNQRREIEGLGATLRQAVGVEKQAGAWKVSRGRMTEGTKAVAEHH